MKIKGKYRLFVKLSNGHERSYYDTISMELTRALAQMRKP